MTPFPEIGEVMPVPMMESPVSNQRISSILIAVSLAFNVTRREILSHRRGREHMRARHAAYLLVRDLTDYSFPRIGRALNRDHSSVFYGAKRAQRMLVEDGDFASLVQRAREALS